jgi:hypothetical protein
MLVERLTQPGGAHAEGDEHDREGEAEQQRRAEHPGAAATLLDVDERDARDRGQVAGHEWQDTRRDERDEADREGGHDRRVDGVGGDHRS